MIYTQVSCEIMGVDKLRSKLHIGTQERLFQPSNCFTTHQDHPPHLGLSHELVSLKKLESQVGERDVHDLVLETGRAVVQLSVF